LIFHSSLPCSARRILLCAGVFSVAIVHAF
jgi:hypothetical protein